MTMSELTDLTLTEIVAALQAGELSSRELTAAFLARSQALEPRLHAYLTLTPERALAQADAADRQLVAWRTDRSAPPPAAAGRAAGGQGRAVRGRRALHLRFADPGELRAALQRHGRRAPAGGRGGDPGQDQHR